MPCQLWALDAWHPLPTLPAVFVAGSTGRLGARIVRELLGTGFKVRAGVRSAEKAETFLNIASTYGLLTKDELSRLQVRRLASFVCRQQGVLRAQGWNVDASAAYCCAPCLPCKNHHVFAMPIAAGCGLRPGEARVNRPCHRQRRQGTCLCIGITCAARVSALR